MNITEMLGTPVRDDDEVQLPERSACGAQPTAPTVPAERVANRRRSLLAIAVGALAAGCALGWYFGTSRATGDTAPTPPTIQSVVPADVAGTAEIVTALYLRGGTSATELSALYTGADPPESATWVSTARTVGAELIDEGTWNVLIAVDSLEEIEGAYEPARISYYLVPMSTESGRAIATAAPGRVPSPQVITAPDPYSMSMPLDQAAAATGFIERYLTGAGDAVRYLSPIAVVPDFETAPYVSAIAEPVGVDAAGRVRVAVSATNDRGITHRLEYTLSLTFDGQSWRVAAMDTGR